MRAEVGFVRDWGDDQSPGYGRLTDRLEIIVSGQSSTEHTMLATFAKRLGFSYDPSSGAMTIQEPAPAILPDNEAR
jgi:hypothetical protein